MLFPSNNINITAESIFMQKICLCALGVKMPPFPLQEHTQYHRCSSVSEINATGDKNQVIDTLFHIKMLYRRSNTDEYYQCNRDADNNQKTPNNNFMCCGIFTGF